MDGIIVIDKPKNKTSRDVVNEVCQILHTKKVGHTGTLDPLATGVLVICVGKATKLVEMITAYDKEYITQIQLGIKTDTKDITGAILEKQNVDITTEQIEKALKDMTKIYLQTVPIYSAVKVNGKKLYEYARNKKEVKLPTREVKIQNLRLIDKIKKENQQVIFTIECHVSKGTYIRSLIEDIAEKMGTIGTMTSLRRTKQGMFDIQQANTLENLKNNQFYFYSVEDVLKEYKQIEVNKDLEFKVKNGALIPNLYQEKIVVFTKNNKVIAIYKEYEKDRSFIKPWKMLL